ncbi:hypothetical protein TNCV_1501951 [Trichonephila clavipes]|uniref:Uncharacterized protein n=1 Tax=Trichonephila clavipes TaxID=2585209 RepID=A0A8X6RT75_TRICX|nr:hypothetical protein TNCV_1501951 [Trichonephila clavipes]
MEKGLENVQKCQEDLKISLEKKIDSVEEKINTLEDRIVGKMEEEIALVEDKMEKKVEGRIERFREEEWLRGNFNLVSQRVEDLEKKLLAGGNENKSKNFPVATFPKHVPVTAFAGPVKLSTSDGKISWEGEIQKAVRMADIEDIKSALLYALKLEAVTQASRRNHQSIRGARVTLDVPCESP